MSACQCKSRELRRRKQANGVVIVGYQCLQCGRCAERVGKDTVDVDRLPWWDEERQKKFWGHREALARREYAEKQADLEREQQERERQWRERYNAHIQSDKWQDLRRRVFARCKRRCEGCGERPAAQVHHLTYDHLGDEFLFELVAVCMSCHERIHDRPLS
jgi:hypothetical protein